MEDREQYLVGGAAVVVVAVLAVPVALNALTLDESEQVFEMNASAVNASGEDLKNIGIVADQRLDFGRIPYQSTSTKFINISAPGYSKVSLSADGNISDSVDYSKEQWFEGDKEISLTFNASEPGYYTGELAVKTALAKNSLGEQWLNIRKSLPF